MKTGKLNCRRYKAGLILFILLYLIGCRETTPYSKTIHTGNAHFDGDIVLEKIEKLGKYRLTINNSISGQTDCIYTPYEVFHMETGDVNQDGKLDICIGIIKPTPFDSTLKKRLFIFQIDRDYIRPLWLSSRLVHPLETFSLDSNAAGQPIIRTIERRYKNNFCINEYHWESFGMAYVQTEADSIPYSNAVLQLNNKIR